MCSSNRFRPLFLEDWQDSAAKVVDEPKICSSEALRFSLCSSAFPILSLPTASTPGGQGKKAAHVPTLAPSALTAQPALPEPAQRIRFVSIHILLYLPPVLPRVWHHHHHRLPAHLSIPPIYRSFRFLMNSRAYVGIAGRSARILIRQRYDSCCECFANTTSWS